MTAMTIFLNRILITGDSMKLYTAIGTMSGTSMDGIDVSLLKTDGEYYVSKIAAHSLTYPDWFHILLKSAEYAVRNKQGNLPLANQEYQPLLTAFLQQELCYELPQAADKILKLAKTFIKNTQLNLTLANVIHYSTQLHLTAISELLAKTHYTAADIDVIGYHGQTLFHNPAARITLQVGDAHWLANKLSTAVVSNFRQHDIEHGGQGAPLAPIFHQALAVQAQLIPGAVINCGGVSNITYINGPHAADLISFDIGPGNGLIDRFVKQRTQGRYSFDEDGRFGLNGKLDQDVLVRLKAQALWINETNYLLLPPPKSLDIADFKLLACLDTLSLEDGCRTLETFTAECISDAFELIRRARPSWEPPKHIVLAGGGWYNPVIKQALEANLAATKIKISTADELGWNNKSLEAQIFAYLATRTLQAKPISFPETTGVSKPLCGGVIAKPD